MKTKLTSVEYMGFTAMDKRFSPAMIPWVVLEIKRRGFTEKLCLGLEAGCLAAYDQNFEIQFSHKLTSIVRYSPVAANPCQFFCIIKDPKSTLLNCYLFQADEEDAVAELLGQMKDHSIAAHAAQYRENLAAAQTATNVASNRAFRRSSVDDHDGRSEKFGRLDDAQNGGHSSETSLTSLSMDISPSSSHFFEVLYIGKIKVSHRKVPQTLIDDALTKFRQHQADRTETRRHSLLYSQANSFSSDNSDQPESAKVNLLPIDSLKELNTNLTSKSYENLSSHTKNDTLNKEFDAFSKDRWEKSEKVGVNGKKHNLSTLEEDETEHAPSKPEALANDRLYESSDHAPRSETPPDAEQIREKSVSDPDESEKDDRFDGGSAVAPDKSSTMYNIGARFESLPENEMFHRHRSASIGTLNLNKTPIAQLIGEQNRTMLFQVGRTDLRLISPDRKQILLHKQLKDIASCALGQANGEHFGFICRESNADNFIGYIFKCESESVANEVICAIRQAFSAQADVLKLGKDKTSSSLTCEHCPMLWYHRLCQDIEGMTDKRIHSFILKRLEQLCEDEQEEVMAKYQGGTDEMYEVGEHNAFLMMLLRAHCEAKQQRHIHDTAENRSEFLNQYLGGSTIFMKAKRSLSSSFDHLLKRKASKDDFGSSLHLKKETSPVTPGTPSASEFGSQSEGIFLKPADPVVPPTRARSVSPNPDAQESEGVKSPMMDIFMKVGTTSPRSPQLGMDAIGSPASQSQRTNQLQQHSWRQAIFNRAILSPVQKDSKLTGMGSSSEIDGSGVTTQQLLGLSSMSISAPIKRDGQQLRQLWKRAINQAILLVRMEKENARLKVRQEESAVKRIKLDYEDLSDQETKFWDLLLVSKDTRIANKVDAQMLMQAVRQGIPKYRRGEIWWLLAEQHCLRHPPPDTKDHPLYNAPYKHLLTMLTSHQHAILIDIGRTFPQHSYFSSPLGPGQLALYNLLKAYSLLDPQLGYCQGLSFVAAVLLLHMDESEAFMMLRHLMFRRGLRKQYLPDMNALQIQLYQMSRLLRDHIPELYEKFDLHDVSPTLYAAPWMLTLFTSQFPLGFVARVFDMVFLDSSEVILRVALALFEAHRDGLMLCESFEEIMEYLKHKMPNIDKAMMDKVVKQVFLTDFSKKLNEYQVEYHVLQEEMLSIAPKIDALNQFEAANRILTEKNTELMDQLEMAVSTISTYQSSQSKLELQIRSLEQSLTMLARYVATNHKGEMPTDIRRLLQQNDKRRSANKPNITDPMGSTSATKKQYSLKTGLSTPNLFNNKPPEAVITVGQIEEEKFHEKKKQFLTMKKSHSFHPDLLTKKGEATIRGFPLRVLDEATEYASYKNATSPECRILSSNPDSGISTPVSPMDKCPESSPDAVFHPLSGLDVDIKFDGHSTQLKSLRPMKNMLNGRTSSIDSNGSKS